MFRSSLILLSIFGQVAAAQSADSFFKDTFEQMLRQDPQFATSVGHHENDNRWTDWSKAARDRRRHFFEDRLRTANGFSTAALSQENQLTRGLSNSTFAPNWRPGIFRLIF
ncbi:MAG: DUF885 domain-containing protein [Acidobacteriota bacterium]|nr:DUF885 domain-containing protein [Acidobacteriota bacterium]